MTGKAPFRVIYSNDTTNILTCISPYHARRQPFRPEMLEATVDEVAGTGVDAHFIQLAHGQVPWYRSKVYPIKEHIEWWKEHFGVDPMAVKPNSVHQYLLEGGDLLQVFVDRCRKTGQAPFVSLRLNDVHFANHVHEKGNADGQHAISRFYVENLDCRLGDDLNDWLQRTLDWSRDRVREHMFAMIEEQCEGYDIDGFELDFMRFPHFFDLERTTSAERAGVMTGFVSRVRQLLDRTARPGRHRWLCVRIPAFRSAHDALGIDLAQWVTAGVEMVNLSYHYFTEQDGDLAAIRELAPEVSMYVEMTHATAIGRNVTGGEHDNFTFRRTTPQQFRTTAHLAYAAGLDGVSAFNFVYYREHGGAARGPFDEPPFEVFHSLREPATVARGPHHYILGNVWDCPPIPNRPLPRQVTPGATEDFRIQMAPPSGGWTADGCLRIQAEEDLGDSRWSAQLNGHTLIETDRRVEPFGNPYSPMLGAANQHRAWTVPADGLKNGVNDILVKMESGTQPVRLVFVDIAVEQ